jgi:hypothetical protein
MGRIGARLKNVATGKILPGDNCRPAGMSEPLTLVQAKRRSAGDDED